jgi:hypothetical protein
MKIAHDYKRLQSEQKQMSPHGKEEHTRIGLGMILEDNGETDTKQGKQMIIGIRKIQVRDSVKYEVL